MDKQCGHGSDEAQSLKEQQFPAQRPSPHNHSRVTFLEEPEVTTIESSWASKQRNRATMIKQLYEVFSGAEVTDDMLSEAAKLFSDNYGVWGKKSPLSGKRVSFNARRLREQCLPDAAETSYVRVTVDGTLAGNAFVCRWSYNGMTVCWITQLVVVEEYRERGLATGLLRAMREDTDDVYGIASSHPAACLAAAKAFGTTIERVSLNFIAKNAASIMEASPISYIRDSALRGSLFDNKDSTGLVSGVDTKFFVDHDEPLEVLNKVRGLWDWPLGELLDGHEYLLIIQGRRRRSKSQLLREQAGEDNVSNDHP
ncbi:hypothetical protein GL218_02569 [Daldinia childiae]|uniref:uncharacterized protein n=1 Tax=Daldinia childiae TaxID=326645 RepID=UPI0014466747|nr:uncharacterized protein GL218_02569 [Daldinia childiae]KAF3063906.1 hypothetical protein GL218_02569 [Daldinia childiae]